MLLLLCGGGGGGKRISAVDFRRVEKNRRY